MDSVETMSEEELRKMAQELNIPAKNPQKYMIVPALQMAIRRGGVLFSRIVVYITCMISHMLIGRSALLIGGKVMRAIDIMHPEDAKAIQIIKGVSGCEQLIRIFMELGYEAQYRGESMVNHIRVTTESFPEICRLLKTVVAKVGIREPELYIYNDPEINAYTYGQTNTFIALSSGAVEKINGEELKGIMAHECGHILCKHTLYDTMFWTLKEMEAVLGVIHGTMFAPLYLTLQYWNRKSELSVDRCAAVVVDEEVYQSALVKLASGLKEVTGKSRRLVEQGKQYEAFKRSSLWYRIQQEYRCMFYSHPQLCIRALELDKWKDLYSLGY